MKRLLTLLILLIPFLVKAQANPSLLPGYKEIDHPTGHGTETIRYEKYWVKTKDTVDRTRVHRKEFSHFIITVTLVDGKITAISKPKRKVQKVLTETTN